MDANPSNSIEPDEAEPANRETARDSIFVSATIWFAIGGPQHETRVRNISAGGMMIDFAQARPVGSSIIADIKGVGEVAGTVAWSTTKRLGVHFAQEIDPDAVRYRPTAQPVPGARLPAYTGRRPGLAIR